MRSHIASLIKELAIQSFSYNTRKNVQSFIKKHSDAPRKVLKPLLKEGRACRSEIFYPALIFLLATILPAMAEPIRVLILTGQHNHNWKETTPKFLALYETDKGFNGEVSQTPWAMTPADLERYDVLVSNWNTFGKNDSPTWSAEMKEAFLKWIPSRKGFVVIHAGGSLYYDWPEFQKLIGATWARGTYHPALQEFTVQFVADNHFITTGLNEFKVLDEPWQKMVVNNRDLKILAQTTIPKEIGGTGVPEPMAFVVGINGGRCFNLVLGHTLEAHKNPTFIELLRRGTEWAAFRD